MSNRSILPLLFLGCAVAVAGCGGGGSGSSGTASPADGVTMNFGNIVTRAATPAPPPVTATSSSCVVTGVGGANFTSIQLNDTSPTLAETQLLYGRNFNLWLMLPDGTGNVQLQGIANFYPTQLAWSPNASRIAFTNNGIQLAVSDGSHPGKVTTGQDSNPTFINDSTLAFQRYSGSPATPNIYSVAANGTGLLDLSPAGVSDTSPAASRLFNLLAFTRTTASGTQIWSMRGDGANQTNLSGTTYGDDHAAWAPSAYRLAFSNGGQIWTMNGYGLLRTQITNPPGGSFDDRPTWSADGSEIAFERRTDVIGQIWVMNADGSNQHNVSNDGNDNRSPNWSPYFSKRLFVGAGGELNTAAAGFLFARQGSTVKSFLTFDCTTRDSATVSVQAPSSNYTSNLVMLVQGDALVNLQFVNGYSGVQSIVSGSSPAANGALVDFDAGNGTVTDVIPYQGTRAAGGGRPSVQTTGGVTTIRGTLIGVWDGTGRNHAKLGAREVKLDAKSGAILSVR